jgi:hypothetical protein
VVKQQPELPDFFRDLEIEQTLNQMAGINQKSNEPESIGIEDLSSGSDPTML